MHVGYVAPLTATGYSQAARSYIKALHLAGFKVHTHITSEDPTQEFGEEGKLMQDLAMDAKPLSECDVVIQHREPGHIDWVPKVPNICYTVWEADLIPQRWPWILNDDAAEVWVPSKFSVTAFEKSGVTIPVIKVPHIVDPVNFEGPWTVDKIVPEDFQGRKFMFYMGPWDGRKNPQDLIRAYYRAFSADDNIMLVMRSYRGQHGVDSPAISMSQIKSEFFGKALPPIAFLSVNLGESDINWLHQNAFLFVSMSHAEGWGLCHSQSLAMRVPVLSVNWGGSLEFQNEDNSFLVRVPGLVPTAGFSPGSMYDPNRMHWAFGDIEHAASLMRKAYEDPILCAKKGLAGKQFVTKNFDYETIGQIMADRLNAITTR